MSLSDLEVGNVYRSKSGRVFLAVDHDLLIRIDDEHIYEIRPKTKYTIVRSISVEVLISKWNTTLEVLDSATTYYLKPRDHRDLKKRQRKDSGSKGSPESERSFWMTLRLHRIST